MKLPNISLNPSTHIAYLPYEMIANDATKSSRGKNTQNSYQPIPHSRNNNSQSSWPSKEQSRGERGPKNLFKNTLVEHFYTLFTAPIK